MLPDTMAPIPAIHHGFVSQRTDVFGVFCAEDGPKFLPVIGYVMVDVPVNINTQHQQTIAFGTKIMAGVCPGDTGMIVCAPWQQFEITGNLNPQLNLANLPFLGYECDGIPVHDSDRMKYWQKRFKALQEQIDEQEQIAKSRKIFVPDKKVQILQ